MALRPMLPVTNSIVVELATAVTTAAQTIQLSDVTQLPAPPNYITIGTENNAEVVLYDGIDLETSSITGCLRGQSGTVPGTWDAGTEAYHALTADTINNMMGNIANHTQAASTVTLEAIDGMSSQQVQAAVAELKGRTDNNQTETQAVRVVAEGAAGAAATAGQRAEKGITDAAAAQTTATSAASAAATADDKAVAAQTAAAAAMTEATAAKTLGGEQRARFTAEIGNLPEDASFEDIHAELIGAMVDAADNLTAQGVPTEPDVDLREMARRVLDIPKGVTYVPQAGPYIHASLLAELRITSSTAYEVARFVVSKSGSARVSFGLRTATSAGTAYGRIYKNGIAVGTEYSTNSSATFTQDVLIAEGDVLALYARYSVASPYTYVTSCKIAFDVLPPFISSLGVI